MNVKLTIAILIALAACSPSGRQYVGTLSARQGVCGTGEDSQGQAPAVLSLRGRLVQFAPEGGVIILDGKIDDAGHVLAQSSTPGADQKPFLEVFEGDLVGNRIMGSFANPRCRATVSLVRR